MIAALLTELNAPLVLTELGPTHLTYGQCFVKVLTTGICGAQIAEIAGHKESGPIPHPLGHEASVRVLECGPGVTRLKVDDKAVAHWRKGEGIESEFPRYRCAGDLITPFITAGRIATFATHAVISENRLTAIQDDAPDELATLLGCALSTALATIEHEAKLLMGESVLIIGCGGLGLNLIMAAKMRLAGRIVATDVVVSKRKSALEMGAHEFKEWFSTVDLFDVIIETSGVPHAIEWSLGHLAPSGRFIMVGQPKPGEYIRIPNARRLFDGTGCCIMATQGGRFQPSRDIHRYVDLWRSGQLKLDGIISHRLPLAEINQGLDLVRNGQAGRVMIDCT